MVVIITDKIIIVIVSVSVIIIIIIIIIIIMVFAVIDVSPAVLSDPKHLLPIKILCQNNAR